jgi:16S rRNA processing protein RimM
MTPTRSKRPADSQPGPQFLILARVLRPHGIRGDLSVKVMTQFPERLSSLEYVYVAKDADRPRKQTKQRVTWARPAKNDQWLMHFDGVNDRDAADLFRDQYVLVSLADAVPLEDDEIYLFQVIGLDVQTAEGESLGRVVDIIETGANDVYVVQGGPHGEVLIPAISGVILDTDVQAGILKVQLPPGLLSDVAAEE